MPKYGKTILILCMMAQFLHVIGQPLPQEVIRIDQDTLVSWQANGELSVIGDQDILPAIVWTIGGNLVIDAGPRNLAIEAKLEIDPSGLNGVPSVYIVSDNDIHVAESGSLELRTAIPFYLYAGGALQINGAVFHGNSQQAAASLFIIAKQDLTISHNGRVEVAAADGNHAQMQLQSCNGELRQLGRISAAYSEGSAYNIRLAARANLTLEGNHFFGVDEATETGITSGVRIVSGTADPGEIDIYADGDVLVSGFRKDLVVPDRIRYQSSTPISGDMVPISLDLRQLANGVGFELSIPEGQGDLLGFFGHLTDESLLSQITIDNPTGIVTDSQFKANGVKQVGGGNNVNPAKDFDFGLRFDQQGSANGMVQTVSFALLAPGLTIGHLMQPANGWVFGVRIQSTNGGEGSSKMGVTPGDGFDPVVWPATLELSRAQAGGRIQLNGENLTLLNRAIDSNVNFTPAPYQTGTPTQVLLHASEGLTIATTGSPDQVIAGDENQISTYHGSFQLGPGAAISGQNNEIQYCQTSVIEGAVTPVPDQSQRCNESRPGIWPQPVLELENMPLDLSGEEETWTYQIHVIDPLNRHARYFVDRKPEGMSFDSTTATLSWTPNATDAGEFEVSLRAEVACQELIFTFPLTINDTVNVAPEFTETTLSAALACQNWYYQLEATDGDGDVLSFALLEGPIGLDLDPHTGAMTLVPEAAQAGDHSVRVEVRDGRDGVDQWQFTLTVTEPEALLFISTPALEGNEGETYSHQLETNQPRPNASLSYSLITGPTGVSLDSSGLLSWTPGPADAGSYPLEVLANDGCVETTLSWTLAILDTINIPPEITSQPPVHATACQVFTYTAQAIDGDGDSLVWSVVESPVGMTLADSTLTWRPTVEQVGSYQVSLVVEDGRGEPARQDFTLDVAAPAGQAPVFSAVETTTLKPGDTFQFQNLAIDPDGESLTLLILDGPQGMTLDQENGLNWSPSQEQIGSHHVGLSASDGCYVVSLDFFLLVEPGIVNEPPRITSTPVLVAYAGHPYAYDADAIDPDGDVLQWRLEDGPEQMTINPETGQIDWLAEDPDHPQHQQKTILPNLQAKTLKEGSPDGEPEPLKDLLILSTTIRNNGNEIRAAIALGYTYDIVLPDVWRTLTTQDFANYRAIILGDPDSGNRTLINAAVETTHIWGPAVTGNVLIFGGDPSGHGEKGYTLIENAMKFAADDVGHTGCFVTLSEYYHNTEPFTPVPLLNAFAPESNQADPFTATGVGCYNDIALAAYHPVLDDLTEEDLSGWGCSVHEAFDSWTEDLTVLAIAEDFGSGYRTPAGKQGTPYILARGRELRVTNDMDIFPIRQQAMAGETAVVTVGAIFQERPVPIGTEIRLRFLEGPRKNQTMTLATDEKGLVQFQLTSLNEAEEEVQASFIDANGFEQTTDHAFLSWVEPFEVNAEISVTDNISGDDHQTWVIKVFPEVDYAPGHFTSIPVLTAIDGELWTYRPTAETLDGNPSPIRLDKAPVGMTFDQTTGLISWIPTYDQRGDIVVSLSTGPEETAQWFVIHVEPGENEAPIFYSSPPEELVQNHTMRYTLNVQDPERDTFTLALVEFPRGMSLSGQRLYYTPTVIGQFPVRVRATDQYGLISEQAWILTVLPNHPPEFLSQPLTLAGAGSTYQYPVSFLDPEGDPTSIILRQKPTGMSLSVNNLVWQPTLANLGDHPVRIEIRDQAGLSNFQEFILTVIDNQAPTFGSNPQLDTRIGHPYTYQVTASDPEGGPLVLALESGPETATFDPDSGLFVWPLVTPGAQTIRISATDSMGLKAIQSFTLTPKENTPPYFQNTLSEVIITLPNSTSINARAIDPEYDPITYRLENAPSGMSISTNGYVTWRPTEEQAGHYHVDIVVTDIYGAEIRANIGFLVNRVPVITLDPSLSAAEGEPYQSRVQAVDPDGDTVYYRLTGTIPEGVVIDAQTGTINWTPGPAQQGDRYIYISAFDRFAGETRKNYRITVANTINLPPSFTSNPILTTEEGRPYIYYATASDPDRDSVRFRLLQAPQGMQITSTRLNWIPTSQQAGTHQVVLQVDDQHGGTALQEFEIVVVEAVNTPPLFTSAPLTATGVAHEYHYPVTVVDSENDPITLSLLESPEGMVLDQFQILRWKPATDGAYSVRLMAEDSQGSQTIQAYTLTVVASSNHAPQILSQPPVSGYASTPYSYQALASDEEHDPIVFSLDTAPQGLEINSETGLITWVPGLDGTYEVVLVATDEFGAAAEQRFTLVIEPKYQLSAEHLDAARSWLALQQGPTGAITGDNTIATDFQATAEAMLALENNPGLISRNAALDFLLAEATSNTEYTARLILLGETTDVTGASLIQRLQTAQSQGFGDRPGYTPTSFDSAWGLRAMTKAGNSADDALALLLEQQNTDGGWGIEPGVSDVYTTALAVRALAGAGPSATSALAEAKAHLLASADEDQLWGEDFLSALNISALIRTSQYPSEYAYNVAALMTHQLENGSWNNDVYITAVALQAMEHYLGLATANKLKLASQNQAEAQTNTDTRTVATNPEKTTPAPADQTHFRNQELANQENGVFYLAASDGNSTNRNGQEQDPAVLIIDQPTFIEASGTEMRYNGDTSLEAFVHASWAQNGQAILEIMVEQGDLLLQNQLSITGFDRVRILAAGNLEMTSAAGLQIQNVAHLSLESNGGMSLEGSLKIATANRPGLIELISASGNLDLRETAVFEYQASQHSQLRFLSHLGNIQIEGFLETTHADLTLAAPEGSIRVISEEGTGMRLTNAALVRLLSAYDIWVAGFSDNRFALETFNKDPENTLVLVNADLGEILAAGRAFPPEQPIRLLAGGPINTATVLENISINEFRTPNSRESWEFLESEAITGKTWHLATNDLSLILADTPPGMGMNNTGDLTWTPEQQGQYVAEFLTLDGRTLTCIIEVRNPEHQDGE